MSSRSRDDDFGERCGQARVSYVRAAIEPLGVAVAVTLIHAFCVAVIANGVAALLAMLAALVRLGMTL